MTLHIVSRMRACVEVCQAVNSSVSVSIAVMITLDELKTIHRNIDFVLKTHLALCILHNLVQSQPARSTKNVRMDHANVLCVMAVP